MKINQLTDGQEIKIKVDFNCSGWGTPAIIEGTISRQGDELVAEFDQDEIDTQLVTNGVLTVDEISASYNCYGKSTGMFRGSFNPSNDMVELTGCQDVTISVCDEDIVKISSS